MFILSLCETGVLGVRESVVAAHIINLAALLEL